MAGWTAAELTRIANVQELSIATRRPDGSLRGAVPIWVVRVGDELFVRSYRGRSGGWFRHALEQRPVHISAGGVQREVRVEEPSDPPQGEIGQAYRAKYGSYGRSYVEAMLAPAAVAATVHLLPC